MADLTGSTIASSYDQLLALPSGGGDGSTLVALTDGNAGNTFALQVSTAGVKSTGTLNVAGITTMSGDLRLEDDAGGEYFGIGTPATVTTYTLTVPAAVGGSGQALRTSDGSGTLEWYTPETGDITGVTAGTGLSGGGTSGTVTLNVEASQTQITALGTIGTGVWQGTAVDGTYIDLEGTEVKSTGETGGTKYLREDGDGTCSWQAATATLTIDSTSIGSSTAGSVLFVNSSNQLSQDNDKLFFDATNFLLGVGTSSPTSNVGFTGPILNIDGSSPALAIKGTAGQEGSVGTQNGLFIDSVGHSTAANNVIVFRNNDSVSSYSVTERMRIDSAGNVGIGGSPTAGILHTIGTGNQAVRVECTNDNHSRLELDADRSAEGYVIGSFDGLWNGTRVGAMQVLAGADTTNKDDGVIRFNTTSGGVEAERMRIDSAGNVGIGGSPSKTLHVKNTTGIAQLRLDYNGSYSDIYADSNIYMQPNGTTCIGFKNGGNTDFYNASGAVKMIWDATNERLGIGGTPSTKLHVIDGNGGIRVGSSNDWGYIHGRTTGDAAAWFVGYDATNLQIGTSGAVGLQLVTNSSPAVSVDTSGNVGIGRTPTTNILECEGTVSATTAGVFGSTARTASYAQVECYRSGNPYVIGYDTRSSATGTGGYIQWNVKGGDGGYDSVGAVGAVCTTTHATLPGGALVFHTAEAGSAAAEKMRISEAGLVGIANTAPSRTLEIGDGTGSPTLGLDKSDAGDATIFFVNAGSQACWIQCTAAEDLKIGTNNATRITVLENGSCGIGTTAPVTKLTVEGAVTLKEQAAADSDTAAYGQIWVKTGTPNTLYFTDDAGTDVQLGTGGSSGVTALSETATVTIDFSSTKLQTLTVTGTCDTLATSNRSAGKEVVLRIYNNAGDYGYFAPTTPNSSADWKEIDQSISSTGVLDGAYGILKLTSWGTADTDVTAELLISP